MKSAQTERWTAAKQGGVWNANKHFQPSYVAVDTVTTETEVTDNVVYLFGPGLNKPGLTLIPERIIIRTGGTAGTISYVGILEKVAADGTVTALTGNITLNRTIPAVAAANVLPQVPLLDTDRIRLRLSTVTTNVVGVIWEIEMPFREFSYPQL